MKKADRKGSALLIVIGIVLVISLATAALSYHASHQMHASKVTREQLKARLIAESGLNKAFHEIRQDFDQVHSYSDTGEFGDGAFAVTNAPLYGTDGSVLEDRAQLVSHGTCGGVGRSVVKIDVERRSSTTVDPGTENRFFNLFYNVLVNGIMKMNGNFYAGVENMHINEKATISGAAHGDMMTVSSSKTVTWKKADGSVTLLNNQSRVEVVTEALLAAIQMFIEHAISHGAVYENGADIPESPPGGIAYCTGNPGGWSREGKGCFIFAGDASFQGNALDVESVNGYPAIIVLGTGEVKMNAGSRVDGAIIVPYGSLTLNGHAEIHGALVVGQEFKANGTADLHAGVGAGFNLPPEETTTEEVVITAWH